MMTDILPILDERCKLQATTFTLVRCFVDGAGR